MIQSAGKPIVRRGVLLRTTPLAIREATSSISGKKRRELVGLIPYNSKSVDLGGFQEIVTPSAFLETMRQGIDVKALFAHDVARPLGRVKNGSLRLRNTPEGLECIAVLPETSYAEDLYQLVKRGDVNTMSFGFNQAKTKETTEGGKTISHLLSVNLLEVSFGVVFPAYEATSTSARIDPGALPRYLSSLETAELMRLHKAFCQPSSLKQGNSDTKKFLEGLHAAAMRV
jgi:HK97 family phage prohead protease